MAAAALLLALALGLAGLAARVVVDGPRGRGGAPDAAARPGHQLVHVGHLGAHARDDLPGEAGEQPALLELAHHAAHAVELLQELVHGRHAGAAAARDAPLAAHVDQLRPLAL